MSQIVVNLQAKNLLAKLLASENIWIQHRKIDTAAFDLTNRILIFPMWKDMSDVLYTMLSGHEVGHAKYSYDTDKDGKRVNVDVTSYAKRIDPNNLRLAGTYWNIVEDARIERLIKNPYPGLNSIFAQAYQELFDKDIFGIKNVDIHSLPFIDRVNLHFKIGHLIQLRFSSDEETLIAKVASTLTMENVLEVTKEIYNWSKQNEVQPPPPITLKMTREEFEKMMGKMETESDEQSDEENDKEENNKKEPKKNNKSGQKIHVIITDSIEEKETKGTKDETEEPKEAKKTKGTDKDIKSKDVKSKNVEKTATGYEVTKPVDPSVIPPKPTTQQNFDNKIINYQDNNATEIVYVTLPTPNLSNIIVDYKEVQETLHSYFSLRQNHLSTAKQEFETFRNINMPKIDYILQQFEMKKQAERYKKTKQYKTGSLDTLRLHLYKTEEDLFKTISIVTDGKNHGLIFVVDWSGSMSGYMAETLEQLIILTLFCRKAQIPFEVYSFTTGSGKKSFSSEPGNLIYASNFRMRNYLSSRMTAPVFHQSCINLFALMPNRTFIDGPTKDHLINCTPLDESIITTIEIIKEFKKRTNAQIVNAIFLTDGGSNTVSSYIDSSGNEITMNYGYSYYYKQSKLATTTRYLIDDRFTHKTYKFLINKMTPTMVEILRDRNNIHAVCFFVGGSWEAFVSEETKSLKSSALKKEFSENGFVISTEWGFNEMYIMQKSLLRIEEIKLVDPTNKKTIPGTPEFMEEAEKNFIQRGKDMQKQRIMLNRFVEMIA